MGLFSSPTCDKCFAQLMRKKEYAFDSTMRGERRGGRKLKLCRVCFFREVTRYIDQYQHRCLAFKPLKDYNAYQFYPISKLGEFNFSKLYIDNLRQILTIPVGQCTHCDKLNPQFGWNMSDEAFGIGELEQNDLSGFNQRLCGGCYLDHFRNGVLENDLYFFEYFPPVDEDGMMSSWEV